MIEIDHNLIREIDTLSDGYIVHHARGAAQCYVNAVFASNHYEKGNHIEEANIWYEKASRYENNLRRFVAKAKYKQAQKIQTEGE